MSGCPHCGCLVITHACPGPDGFAPVPIAAPSPAAPPEEAVALAADVMAWGSISLPDFAERKAKFTTALDALALALSVSQNTIKSQQGELIGLYTERDALAQKVVTERVAAEDRELKALRSMEAALRRAEAAERARDAVQRAIEHLEQTTVSFEVRDAATELLRALADPLPSGWQGEKP